jgi:hypothetical protein
VAGVEVGGYWAEIFRRQLKNFWIFMNFQELLGILSFGIISRVLEIKFPRILQEILGII